MQVQIKLNTPDPATISTSYFLDCGNVDFLTSDIFELTEDTVQEKGKNTK